MSASTRQQTIFSISRAISHLRTPLFGNGYALVLSSTATSILGVAYWILAARNYSPNVVGLNSAAISAMMFLAGVAQLNLTSALIRFIPGAGQMTWRLVVSAYVASISVAGVQRRLTALVTVLAGLCMLVLILSYILLPIYGITGVGLAWLVGQTIIAGILWLTQLRLLWSSHPK